MKAKNSKSSSHQDRPRRSARKQTLTFGRVIWLLAALLALPAQLTAQDPPSNLYVRPTNLCVSLGATVTLRSYLAGTSPFGFQWHYTNSGTAFPLDGAANPSALRNVLNLTNVQSSDAGGYFVVVTNTGGSATSQVAQLTVDPTFAKITTGSIVTDSEASTTSAWGDYDNDGLLDVFVANSAWDSGVASNSLYRNLGGDEFMRATNAITTRIGVSWHGQWGDYDNDGDLDLFVPHPNGARSEVFRNEGGGEFARMTNALTTIAASCVDASWVDHDRDGWLDLFVTARAGQNDFFFRNLGDGTFKVWTTNKVGILVSDRADTYGIAWCDTDNNGDLDLYVSNDLGPGFLHHNDGSGKMERWTAGSLPGRQRAFFVVWGDFNNDGWFDLLTTVDNGTNTFHLNQGNGQFVDATVASGLSWAHSGGESPAPTAGDYDNDGDLDIYLGHPNGRDVLFVNQGDGTFVSVDVGSPLSEGTADFPVWVDYNNDGFLDLFKTCGDLSPAVNLLYRNSLPQAGNTNHWLKVQLRGTASNRSGLGARVWVWARIGGREVRQTRQIVSSAFGGNMGGLLAHFGLGDANNVMTLRIEWPSGTVQEYSNVAANQILTLWEPPAMSAALRADGACELTIKAEPNRGWQIQASSDLFTWQTLTTVTNTSFRLQFTDMAAAGMDCRFYRVKGE